MSDDITLLGQEQPRSLLEREWLVTNGLGGYASLSLLGVVTRRHHGLFVPNLSEPKGRHVLVSSLDEELLVGNDAIRFGGVEHLDGRIDTVLHQHLASFTLRRGVPTWRFHVAGRIFERTIVMPHVRNTVCVCYRLLEGEPLPMRLRPYTVFRRVDDMMIQPGPRTFTMTEQRDHRELSCGPLTLRFAVSGDSRWIDEVRHREAIYFVERDRGYEHTEAIYSAGALELTLASTLTFVATSEAWETIDGQTVLGDEAERKAKLLALAAPSLREGFAAHLVCAADQFIARPGTRIDVARDSHLRTVMAGYHWFADWGRDTMISLEGLTLTTGRVQEAGAILRTFSRYVKDGLLPNLFPEGEREALYHTVDATLWYFHAIERYRRASGDDAIVRELFPVLTDIVDHYVRGTLFGIGVDTDGLVKAGAPGYQLTWMDAKVGDWVVTPRRGKPVEIQALWFNALSLMAKWSDHGGDEFARRAEATRRSFEQRFPHGDGLFDVVDGENGDDASCRPNQIFTLSLDHPILDRARWENVLGVVERELLTPMGLRTLSPGSPDYRRTYEGDLRSRDAAYHQGTVWPWLLGHYIDASLKVRGDKTRARALLAAFPEHLRHAGVGSISEITDAEAPYTPRGCIAQAWSVAEVLRAWHATE